VEVLAPAVIRWSRDGWKTSEDIKTRETGLSLQVADLKTDELPNGTAIDFTIYWPGQNRWEDTNFHVRVGNDPL
jgi:glucoamylase